MFSDYLFFLRTALGVDTVQGKPEKGAPFGKGNAECLELTLEKARELGFDVNNGDGYYGYAETGEGELFGILGHLDVVPTGDGWTRSPYGEISDGYLYGRGVLDDKGPILACLFAAAELIREGFSPKKKLRLIFGCNEESGWKCMDMYEKNEVMPAEGFSPDGDFPVINCEKGIVYYSMECAMPEGVNCVSGGQRPNMVMDECRAVVSFPFTDAEIEKYGLIKDGEAIVASGKSAHGSTPAKGENAFHKILSFLSEKVGGAWKTLYSTILPTDGAGAGLMLSDEKSGSLSLNVGTVKTENGKLIFSLDIRYPVTFEKGFIRERVESAFDFLTDVNITETMCHAPLYLSPDDDLLKKLLSAYDEITGGNSEPISIGGGTYARALPKGAAFGPIFPDSESTIHQRDERASLADLKKMYDIYKLAIKKLCFE